MGEKQSRWDRLPTERWEPYEARVSRTVLRGPGGEVPLGYSLKCFKANAAELRQMYSSGEKQLKFEPEVPYFCNAVAAANFVAIKAPGSHYLP